MCETGYVFPDLSAPVSSLLIVNYYDTYDFLSLPSFMSYSDSLSYLASVGYGERYMSSSFPSSSAFGKLTGKRTYLPGTDEEIMTVYYYDDCGRVIQTRSTNHLDGYDTDFFLYTFTGKVKKRKHVHTVPGKASYTEQYMYEYDHADRLLSVCHSLNGCPPVQLALHEYDEFCRLSCTSFHDGMTKVRYDYNIRDWLIGIDSPHFKQALYYNDGTGTPCYNGNISSMIWKAGEDICRGYKFYYDGLNRLKEGIYGEGASITVNPGRFTEQVTGYDKQGNILGLKRYGQMAGGNYGMTDSLTLAYTGNRLKNVKDWVGTETVLETMDFKDGADELSEYEYDENGNLIKDSNKNIAEIEYNSLNLPCKVLFDSGNSISYVYDAAGTKLRATHTAGSVTATTEYCGNAVYENGVLSKLLTEQGYITFSDGKYHYFHSDHQGNVRVVTDWSGQIEEVNHYYPFGSLFSISSKVQPYKYNGKELDRRGGLDWYDYGARLYDASLGRWHAVDPLAEKYPGVSPYGYCVNNPVRYIDPTGEFPIETIWDIGNVLYDVGAAVVNHIKGDHKTARSHWGNVALDAGAILIPYVPAGTSKVIKGGAAGVKALDKATDVKKVSTITENAAKGKAFEKQVGNSLGNNKASQVTIEAADGTRTKVDFAQKQKGKITLTEAKGSQTAPLTRNQKIAHPQIETSGGTIRGNKGIEIGLPSGTKIPPTKIEIIRPEDLLKK
ncbi:RHS repeat domain-containing protein [Bacteroides pyogenes]|uniref:RHS repeat domain-containing protein n=1 Tax=Bacteroides pyogenes TaxID=310300 RepID=UPI001F448A41|nr:RHS repeat-associated core domain-containing protein [Bacteroides pyogenes]MCF2709618.1 RHS repeat-associated core domain-containing protein [Bacteroides pyogenes]